MRITLRLIAVIILLLMGAPLAMHVVVHDLHQDHHEAESDSSNAEHGGHEHPVITSAAPQLPALTATVKTPVDIAAATRVSLVRASSDERITLGLGAVRLEDDTGLQSLLSTFLI